MMSARISTAEASRLMGIPQQAIRVQMQRGIIDIGSCAKLSGGRYLYYIMQNKVLDLIGKQECAEKERVYGTGNSGQKQTERTLVSS